jgi:hypothetical protein
MGSPFSTTTAIGVQRPLDLRLGPLPPGQHPRAGGMPGLTGSVVAL